MDLHLTDEQIALLVAELDRIIDSDRYPLSARVRALREIRAVLKPYPERPPHAADPTLEHAQDHQIVDLDEPVRKKDPDVVGQLDRPGAAIGHRAFFHHELRASYLDRLGQAPSPSPGGRSPPGVRIAPPKT